MSIEYLLPKHILQEQATIIVVGIYTDKITASIVKRENGKIVVSATTTEPQEGSVIFEKGIDVARITLNCQKALATLLQGKGNSKQEIVFACGGGISSFSFLTEKTIREKKERKITTQEIDALISSHLNNKSVISKIFAESFYIDGFSVSNPVGMNGGELSISATHMACENVLIQALSCIADIFELTVKGIIDMRYFVARYDKIFEKKDSAILLCIFEQETSVILINKRKIANSSVIPTGYGILTSALEKSFLIGSEEAKKIFYSYNNKKLEENVYARVTDIFNSASSAFISGISDAVLRIDSASLLPGNVWLVLSEDAPQITDLLISSKWLSSIPIERNAVIEKLPTAEQKTLSPFDGIITELL